MKTRSLREINSQCDNEYIFNLFFALESKCCEQNQGIVNKKIRCGKNVFPFINLSVVCIFFP